MYSRVLVTACGCPGGPSVIRQLQEAGFWVMGTDANPQASGRFFADKFAVSPRGDAEDFVPVLLELCEENGIAVLLPESSAEVYALASSRYLFRDIGVHALVSDKPAVALALNKVDTYKVLTGVVPLPRWEVASTERELIDTLCRYGYPERRVVIKSPHGKGGRGFYIVEMGVNRCKMDMRKWPNSQLVTIREAVNGPMPVMVMEYLEGDESSADTFDTYAGEASFGFTKIRRDCRMGLHHSHEAKHDWQLMKWGRLVVETLGLEYFCNVQFMADKLLEVNPRISTTLWAPGFNFPAAGVRVALGMDPGIGELPDGTRAQYYSDLRSW